MGESRNVVGVTGTPGTGKKTISPILASALGVPCHSLNEIALEARLVGPGSEVDAKALRRRVAALPGPCVVYGHLLPEVLPRERARRAFVLRCEPRTLKRRLLARGYSKSKVRANVESELIGLISSRAFAAYGRSLVVEWDSTSKGYSSAGQSLKELMVGRRRPIERLDWTTRYDSAPRLKSLLSGLASRDPR